MKLGVYGEQGSFSHAAGLQYLEENNQEAEIVYLVEFDNLFRALAEGEIDIAILPVVNQNGGLVMPAFEIMGQYEFVPTYDLKLAVVQCLMTLPDTNPEDITEITSHPQAHRQCKGYLAKNHSNAKLVEWNDTASAARDLAAGTLPKTAAVLASKQAAEMYDLKLVKEGCEDNPENFTTFIALKTK